MPFLKKRRTRRSSKRVSKARRYLPFHRPNAPKHALRLPQSARQDDSLRPSRRRFPVLSAHRTRRARRSSKRVSKARRPVLSPPERAEALHCAFRNPRGRTTPSVRHAAGSRFFLRIALPRPPQLETRLKGAPTCPFAARTRRSIALRLPQSARQDGSLRPSRRRFQILSAHRAAARAAARNAPQRRANACPFAARTRRSMHCAFRNPRGRTASSVRHAAGSRSRPRSHV